MSEKMQSAFQMSEFVVRQFVLHKPAHYEPKDRIRIGFVPTISAWVDENNNSHNAVITLHFRLTENDSLTLIEDGNQTFAVEMIVQASFIAASDAHKDLSEFEQMAKTAGAATMIPIARAHMISANALFGIPSTVKIPNINVHNIDSWVDAE
jgi:hypothetical protein